MSYKKIDSHIISEFLSFLDEKQVIASENEKLAYAQDKTEDFVYMPELVLIPDNAEDISKILKIKNSYRFIFFKATRFFISIWLSSILSKMFWKRTKKPSTKRLHMVEILIIWKCFLWRDNIR